MKGPEGIPVPDTDTFPGLLLALELSATGKSDSEVAHGLNAEGYRTVGSRGGQPFKNSSLRWILRNRFYLGLLPDGKGGWVEGKHEAFIEQELWDQVQAARSRNRTSTRSSCTPGSQINSLTGLPRCCYCGERIHTQSVYQGKPRLGCSIRIKGWDCQQRSAYLSVYEPQTLDYLKTFHIPEDYQEQILKHYQASGSTHQDAEADRKRLKRQLERERDLYRMGDVTKAEYERRRDDVRKQLDALARVPGGSDSLPLLAEFLADVASAWEVATPEQQNKLARTLFEEIWIKDKVVVVKPRPELDPFFRLNYEESISFEGVISTSSENTNNSYGVGRRRVAQTRDWHVLDSTGFGPEVGSPRGAPERRS